MVWTARIDVAPLKHVYIVSGIAVAWLVGAILLGALGPSLLLPSISLIIIVYFAIFRGARMASWSGRVMWLNSFLSSPFLDRAEFSVPFSQRGSSLVNYCEEYYITYSPAHFYYSSLRSGF